MAKTKTLTTEALAKLSLFDATKADTPYKLTDDPQNNFTRVPNDYFVEKKSSYSDPEKARQSAHGTQNLFHKMDPRQSGGGGHLLRPLIMTYCEELIACSHIHARKWEEISEYGKHKAELLIVANAQQHGWCVSDGKHPTTLRDVVGCSKSQYWMDKFEADRVGTAIDIYKICIKPLEQRDWALRATTGFLNCHTLTLWDGSASDGKKHSVFRIASATGKGHVQSNIQAALETGYGFSIRTE